MVAALLGVGGGLQQKRGVHAVRGRQSAHAKFSRGQCSSFIHDHRINVGRALKHARGLNHNSKTRRRREGRDHGGWIRNQQRAGTCHNKYGHRALGGLITNRGNFTFAGEEPHKRRHHQHNWNVIRRQALDQFLFMALRIFRLANQRLHFSNCAFTRDRRHFDIQLSREIGGSSVNRGSFAGFNGNRFTSQTGLIHAALP